MFSIHLAKRAALNEGLRWWRKTTNETNRVRAHIYLSWRTSVNEQSDGEKHGLIVDINHMYYSLTQPLLI